VVDSSLILLRIWIGEFEMRSGVRVNTDDFYRKKAEQQEARDAIKQQKADVTRAGGDLGQTGGPANPVDNPAMGGNYPNTGA
jgi:hypothetical protein